jgi:hypothetical protein
VTTDSKSEKAIGLKTPTFVQNGSGPALGASIPRNKLESYYLTIFSKLPACFGYELAIRKAIGST